MGGQAFTNLCTPRMPPSIYIEVLQSTQTLLRQHYRLVGFPIEGPGKETFGDVDVLVFDPLPSSSLKGLTSRSEVANQLSQILNAVQHIEEAPTLNFAIPWPNSPSHHQEETDTREYNYIQLDVKVCESDRMFKWELFHAAHGDLWSILGSIIRPFGLTVNSLGLLLRIPDIEKLDRKKSMVFLTDDPGLILDFLGLEKERWWMKFESRERMFEYAAECRMFWVKDIDELENEGGMGMEVGELGKKKLKHNDRARMAKRPIFREWMEVFLPTCRVGGSYVESRGITRERVREEAFVKFGDDVRVEYEKRLREWSLARHTDIVWREIIKGSVPEIEDLQFRAASIRTLKGVVIEGEEFKGAVMPEVAPNEEGFWNLENVRGFVEANWKEAGEIGWARQQARAMEGMKAKTEEKRLQAEERTEKTAKIDDGDLINDFGTSTGEFCDVKAYTSERNP